MISQFSRNRSYSFLIIAETNHGFTDFAPYVASINNKGTVSFQAAQDSVHSGIFKSDGNFIQTIAQTHISNFKKFYSHPDISDNTEESICFYASLTSGEEGVYGIIENELITFAETNSSLKSIGPLGPTINTNGSVAFRARLITGESAVFTATHEVLIKFADTSKHIKHFSGLPVVNNSDDVVFRAELKNGSQCICSGKDSSYEVIVESGGQFLELGSFPDFNNTGTLTFSAMENSGVSGIFTSENGKLKRIIDTESQFKGFRGSLINNGGDIVFFAISGDGRLGIYNGPDPVSDKILSVGDQLFDSEVEEFALNPVSINHHLQLAVRLKFINGKQMIIRADPN
jgi:hypothetical protein